MVRIDKGVAIPKTTGSGIKKYPFDEMEIGDSIFFDNEPLGSSSNPVVSARMYARYKKDGTKFISRKEGTGVRIWRVT